MSPEHRPSRDHRRRRRARAAGPGGRQHAAAGRAGAARPHDALRAERPVPGRRRGARMDCTPANRPDRRRESAARRTGYDHCYDRAQL